MGLFDILMGRPDRMIPGGGLFGRRGGMSPITMGVLGLLAYKAIQGLNKPGGPAGSGTGGGIGDWLRRTFGDSTGTGTGTGTGRGGSGGGGILSGGLRDLLGQFQQSGHGDVAKSWVDTGTNRPLTPDTLAKVLTEEQIATLMEHTGLSRDELLRGMSDELPNVVDKLTPQGEIPSPQDMDRVIDGKAA